MLLRGLVPTAAALLLVLAACGSRSTLLPGEIPAETDSPDAAPPPECNVDEDCGDSGDLCAPWLCHAGQCVQRFTLCNDGDPCTKDTCDGATGQCTSAPATLDLDGDGHDGPLPGTVAGAPGSCGDDCDDTRDSAFPGNTEVCDSVDNDCNGVVDDGAGYAPPPGGLTDVRVSSAGLDEAIGGGLAHDGTRYFLTYGGTANDRSRTLGTFVSSEGELLSQETRLVQVESDTQPSGAVWTGDRYGVLWSDRRASNYEVFFAMFDPTGKKMAPGDIKLSSSEGFSINGDFAFTGTEFVAVWQDGDGSNGSFSVVGRRIGLDGALLGDVVTIAAGESPKIAVGRPGMGVVYTGTGSPAQTSKAYFRALDFALAPLAAEVPIENDGDVAYPSIRFNADAYVITWGPQASPFQLFGTALDGLGQVKVPTRQLTASPGHARFGSVVPLGDRLLMVYSDDRDGNYEIYSQTYDPELTRVGLPTRITDHEGVSKNPRPLAGPQGEIGVQFEDQRDGRAQTYFTRLVCNAGE